MNDSMNSTSRKYFKKALEHILDAGHSVRDFSEFALEKFGDRALPHLQHFYQEVRHGNIRIKGLKKSPREILFGLHVTPQQREEMIRLAAYVRAEERGFAGGSPDQDWMEAEREVDERLAQEAGLVASGRKAMLSMEEVMEKEYTQIRDVVSKWFEKTTEKGMKIRKAVSVKKSDTKKPAKRKVARNTTSKKNIAKKKTVKKKPAK